MSVPTIAAIDPSLTSTGISVCFTVFGTPAQMGSKRAFVVKGRAILTDDNSKKRKQWAGAVADVAGEAMSQQDLISGPVKLSVQFHFARPKSHFGTGRNAQNLKGSAPSHHAQSPDLDKLIRCLGDALTGIVFRDDRQICEISATRHWTTQQERAEVQIESL